MKTLRDWIDAGMPWEAGFTFAARDYEPPLRPRRPELPPADDGGRIRSIAFWMPIWSSTMCAAGAAWMTRRFCGASISISSACCPRRSSCTRLSPARIRPSVSKSIDELLADNQAYAEHWLSFWNDLLRNDYAGTGYIDGGRKQISAWLYRACGRTCRTTSLCAS